MIRPIVHDLFLLSRPSEPACAADSAVADDLLDTLRAHREDCVGMAANMIGVCKRIIVFDLNGTLTEMFNPRILKQSGGYDTEEGCLSLASVRPVRRFRSIKVQWETRDGKPRIQTFTGFPAQIIQHELDHCNGILI